MAKTIFYFFSGYLEVICMLWLSCLDDIAMILIRFVSRLVTITTIVFLSFHLCATITFNLCRILCKKSTSASKEHQTLDYIFPFFWEPFSCHIIIVISHTINTKYCDTRCSVAATSLPLFFHCHSMCTLLRTKQKSKENSSSNVMYYRIKTLRAVRSCSMQWVLQIFQIKCEKAHTWDWYVWFFFCYAHSEQTCQVQNLHAHMNT